MKDTRPDLVPPCQACGGQVRVGCNQHGWWFKCQAEACKHRWGYTPCPGIVGKRRQHKTQQQQQQQRLAHWRRMTLWLGKAAASKKLIDALLLYRNLRRAQLAEDVPSA